MDGNEHKRREPVFDTARVRDDSGTGFHTLTTGMRILPRRAVHSCPKRMSSYTTARGEHFPSTAGYPPLLPLVTSSKIVDTLQSTQARAIHARTARLEEVLSSEFTMIHTPRSCGHIS